MPINGFPGQVISATAPTVSTAGASGIWTLDEQLQYAGQNLWPGYQISRSVRLRAAASAYFSRTFSSGGSQTTWTFSFWYKRALLSQSSYPDILSTNSGSPNQNNFRWQADDTLLFYVQSSASTLAYLQTTQVFRDPSAWYHIVLTIDTTNATSTDRVRLYVNGQRVTSFSTATYPSQNQTLPSFNGAVTHYLGSNSSTVGFNDCYMTEVNFVNGQALTPSSFGVTSAATGVWGPIKYTGTYGTTGFYLPFPLNNTSSYGASFNGSSQYLTTSTNASLALGTNSFTVEYWLYISSNVGGVVAVTSGNGTTTYDGLFGYQTGSQSILLYLSSTGSSWDIASGTTIGSTPTGTWNHVAITRNGSTFYTFVNGVQGATFTSSASIYQSANSFVMGRAQSNTPLNGYLSNVRVVVGTALYTSNFVPPTTALTAVTNTKLLTLQNATIVDNSTNALTFTNTGSVTTSTQYPFANPTIGADSSGNYNNWAPNNINVTTTGTTYDSMVDVPVGYGSDTGVGGEVRGNYAVINPLDSYTSGVSNGNLKFSDGSGTGYQMASSLATPDISAYSFYCEVTVDAGYGVGIVTTSTFTGGTTTAATTRLAYYSNGQKFTASTGSAYGATFTAGDVIGIAIGGGSITFYKNGVSQGVAFSSLTGSYKFYAWSAGSAGNGVQWNFGQRAFAYTAPSGYLAPCTQNLATPTIVNGANYMNVTLYGGNSSTQTVNNSAGFYPDFNWIKIRSSTGSHVLVNSVVGGSKQLFSNLTNAEQTDTNMTSAISSSGIALGNNSTGTGNSNISTYTYVLWQWLAGAGSSSSNTSGSITSTVSVNATAGFSIVSYTGNGTAGATVGHGLGVAPSMIIVKERSPDTNYNWFVYHTSVGNTAYLLLNTTNASSSGVSAWNNTTPTSSVFTVGAYTEVNKNTAPFIAYCWTPIAGYSAFGSYTGNGSTDGPFVYVGFKPRWILMKSSTLVTNWWIIDTARNTYNVANTLLTPSNNYADDTTYNVADINSNGFKIRTTYTGVNSSGDTYIYACFAENPFKYALAR